MKSNSLKTRLDTGNGKQNGDETKEKEMVLQKAALMLSCNVNDRAGMVESEAHMYTQAQE